MRTQLTFPLLFEDVCALVVLDDRGRHDVNDGGDAGNKMKR
jgi:hypothetical protein